MCVDTDLCDKIDTLNTSVSAILTQQATDSATLSTILSDMNDGYATIETYIGLVIIGFVVFLILRMVWNIFWEYAR